jgi:exodeoxyribonuclease VIII
MLDLETLDTKGTAVVVSIGAVIFDPYSDKMGEKFYRVLNDPADQQRHGRTISGDTVRWWMQQSEAARGALLAPGISTLAALSEFHQFVMTIGKTAEIWGNGADFDNVILGSLYEDYAMNKPWSYSRNRCFRTMKNLPRAPQIARMGTHHNALDDAVHQAQHLQEITKCLLKSATAPTAAPASTAT